MCHAPPMKLKVVASLLAAGLASACSPASHADAQTPVVLANGSYGGHHYGIKVRPNGHSESCFTSDQALVRGIVRGCQVTGVASPTGTFASAAGIASSGEEGGPYFSVVGVAPLGVKAVRIVVDGQSLATIPTSQVAGSRYFALLIPGRRDFSTAAIQAAAAPL